MKTLYLLFVLCISVANFDCSPAPLPITIVDSPVKSAEQTYDKTAPAPTSLDVGSDVRSGASAPPSNGGTFSGLLASLLRPNINGTDSASKALQHYVMLFSSELHYMMIGIELLTMANGQRFGLIVPMKAITEEKDIEMKRIASAIINFWLDLPTSQDFEHAMQKAAFDVSQMVSRAQVKMDPYENITREIMDLYLEKTDLYVRAMVDDTVYAKFSEAKNGNESFIAYPPSNAPRKMYIKNTTSMTISEEAEAFKEWFKQPLVRTFLVHKLFVHESLKTVLFYDSSDSIERTIFAKALVQLSKVRAHQPQVTKLYREVITEIANTFDLAKYPYVAEYARSRTMLGGFNPQYYTELTLPILISKLTERFYADPVLKSALMEKKNDILTKTLLDRQISLLNFGIF